MDLEILIAGPKTKETACRKIYLWQPGSLEDLPLIVAGLEHVPSTPYTCHLKWQNQVRGSLKFSGLTVQPSQMVGNAISD